MKLVTALLVLTISLLATACSPRVRECRPTGSVLLEVDQRAVPQAKLTTATTRLYESGAWTREVMDADGKRVRTEAGCLQPAQLDSILTGLRHATWTTAPSGRSCRADQPRFTVFRWKGRVLYTERTCNAEVLDQDSRAVLDSIEIDLHLPDDPDGPDGLQRVCMQNPLAPGCN